MSNKLKENIRVNIATAYSKFPVERAREWGHIWHNVLDSIDLNEFDAQKIEHTIELLNEGMKREIATRNNG